MTAGTRQQTEMIVGEGAVEVLVMLTDKGSEKVKEQVFDG
jgi:hypothetical protein